MKKLIMAILLTSTLTLADAEPVYLSCYLNTEDGKNTFTVKLDESNGKVTHTRENGSAFNAEGFFSANTITYKVTVAASKMIVSSKYAIDRMDLSLNRVFRIDMDPEFSLPPTVNEDNGACEIMEIKKRKI